MKENKYVDFKDLIKAIIFACATAALILLAYFGIIPYNRMTSVPIAGFVIAGFIFTFKYLKRAIPRSTVEYALSQAFRTIAKGINFVFGPVINLGRKLGLFRNKYKKGRDESSFIFQQPEFRARKAARGIPKYKDLTTNAQRVRWIFMRYLNMRIKKGYHFRRTLTPNQLRKELIKGLDEDALPGVLLLFDVYHAARYDEETHSDIKDELVAELRDKV